MWFFVEGMRRCSKSNVFFYKSLWTYWLRQWFFAKKGKLNSKKGNFFVFCLTLTFFCKRKIYSDLLQVSSVSVDEKTNLFDFLIFLLMAFMTLKIIVFEKKTKVLINFALFLFFGLVVTYSHYWEVLEHIFGLRGRLNWNMALWRRQFFLASLNWIFCVASICCSFCNRIKNSLIEAYVIINIWDVFDCHLLVFCTLKLFFFTFLSHFLIFTEWRHIFSSEIKFI